ncbi:MAG: hypothetical protein JST20_10755 [Bacteroidetes bacterium]|nr:hypothetical protein [Bacteroidota bacterium]
MTIIIVATAVSAYSWTYRKTVGGGKNGYNSTELRRTGTDNKNTIVKASGIGAELAPITTSDSDEQPAMDYALKQISKGVLKGKWNDKKNQKTVVWRASDKTGRTSTIEIVGAGETIPKEVKK